MSPKAPHPIFGGAVGRRFDTVLLVIQGTEMRRHSGQWIGNTDMHLYNLSLAPSDHGFTVLPLYDITSMLFAPAPGELVDRPLTVPSRTSVNTGVCHDAGQIP